MSPERVQQLRAKHAALIADAADADHLADEYSAEGRSPRLIAAQRSRADKLNDIARSIARDLSAASVPA